MKHPTKQIQCHLALDSDMADVWKDMLGYRDDNYDDGDEDHGGRCDGGTVSPWVQYNTSMLRRILVLSVSTFSLVPAIFVDPSTTMVIYTPCDHKPLPFWTSFDWATSPQVKSEKRQLREQFCHSKVL
jgi:hypothetical protein